MIAIIDYGMGNLRSVAKAFEKVGAGVCVTRDADVIQHADKVVLPGVGAFKKCMENLAAFGLIEVVRQTILADKPFLGICLGFQLLFEQSEEFGPAAGLGILPGKVRLFKDRAVKIPHMGWNQLTQTRQTGILKGIPNGSEFYFVHSYYVDPADPELIATTTDYGGEFCSSIARGNLFACQFHPEKSQTLGLRLIQNFAEII